MATLIVSDAFIDDLATIQSERLYRTIVRLVSYLQTMPEMGSPQVSDAARRLFGNGVRKLVAAPFDILYLNDAEHDEVHVDGLVHHRAL